MKLSKNTTDVLKNFASINMSLLFKEGKELKTVSPQKTIIAIANISETVPQEFAVYDLNQFLGILGTFNDPDLTFDNDSFVKISNGSGAEASFRFAAKEAIVSPPDKEMKLPSSEITFRLEEKALTEALKAASMLGLPEICIVGKGDKTFIAAADSNNSASHGWKMEVGTSTAAFNMVFRLDNLKLLSRDYDVTISKKGLAYFVAKSGDVKYYIVTEASSKYGE